MRFVALGCLLAQLVGCAVRGDQCDVDSQCGGGLICARDHSCLDPAQVREVKALWTINGAQATEDACRGIDLYIEFLGRTSDDNLAFAPVPCFTGQFFVDKLPLRFTSVELGEQDGPASDTASIASDGTASLDLGL